MATPVRGPNYSTPATPGVAVNALNSNLTGGYVINPVDAPGVLYVDPVGPASTLANGTTLALQPGQAFFAIQTSTLPVSVASQIPSHNFISVEWL
jgi:hypothetical protein